MRTKTRFSILVAALVLAGIPASLEGQGKVSARLSENLLSTKDSQAILCIIYLRDKGNATLDKIAGPEALISQRALQRRALVLPPGQLIDESDLPLAPEYVTLITRSVSAVRNQLRWFNAISVWATAAQVRNVERLDCVREIDIVGQYRRSPEVGQSTQILRDQKLGRPSANDSAYYGFSYHALSMIHVPEVHQTGNIAQGIIIGMFDNGVRSFSHHAFDSLRSRIIGMRDFVDHKESVVPLNPSNSFGSHGMATLSAIGGYLGGELVGPAFGASFILARTENDSSETPIEEDNWAAGIQWAESLGVQVTSTSLGYLTYDTPYTSWTWQDMNGQTTLITRAAAMAVRKGVIVVNAAGNNGSNPLHNTLNAPADADSVVTVGSVTPTDIRSGFSSVGPTTSIPPMIKPDIMAQGEQVAAASPLSDSTLIFASGTSLACPLAAGAAALVLKAHPTENPYQIATRLRMTGSNAANPDNLIGWGILNAAAAINFAPSAVSNPPPRAGILALAVNPNPSLHQFRINFQLPEQSRVAVTLFDLLGREVCSFTPFDSPIGSGAVQWNGSDNAGRIVSSGVYFVRIQATGHSGALRTQTQRLVILR